MAFSHLDLAAEHKQPQLAAVDGFCTAERRPAWSTQSLMNAFLV